MQTKAPNPWSQINTQRSFLSERSLWMWTLKSKAHWRSRSAHVLKINANTGLCRLAFYLRQILRNVESCLLKWQWSIMTDVVIIGHSSSVWRWILSRLRRKEAKAAPSRASSSPTAFLCLINLHPENTSVLLMHFYHRSKLYCKETEEKNKSPTWSQCCMDAHWKLVEVWIMHVLLF